MGKARCRLCTDSIEKDDLEDAVAPRGYPIGKLCPSCMTLLMAGFQEVWEKTRTTRFEQMATARGIGSARAFIEEAPIWMKPSTIVTWTDCHSSSMTYVPILLWFKGDKYPKLGRYISTPHLKEFREDGCPSECHPDLWAPMPRPKLGKGRKA